MLIYDHICELYHICEIIQQATPPFLINTRHNLHHADRRFTMIRPEGVFSKSLITWQIGAYFLHLHLRDRYPLRSTGRKSETLVIDF